MADVLSTIIQIGWVGIYLIFILMSGWTIMKGFRSYLPWYMRLLGKIGFGFLSLICAMSIAPLIPIEEGTGLFGMILSMIQINFFVAGLISTTVLTISLLIISHKIYNIEAMEKLLERLRLKIEKARAVEKEMAGKSLFQNILQPARLVGIIILAGFVFFALLNFRGFPDPVKNVQDAMGDILAGQGVTPDMIKLLCDFMGNYNQSGNFSGDCVGPIEIVQSFNASLNDIPAIISQLPLYVDSGTKSAIESGSGESVELMYRVVYKEKTYALALTRTQSVCTATEGKFCGCIKVV